MKDSTDEKWLREFNQDLEKLEASFSVEVPSQAQMLDELQNFKMKRRLALRREFIVFLITALFILISYSTLAFKLPSLFIWIQGLLVCAGPIMFIVEKRRRKRQSEVSHYGF